MNNYINSTIQYKRNSAIELLKVLATFIIVISHSVPRYGVGPYVVDFNNAVDNLNGFIMILEFYLGQIGNAIFIVCSVWFLTESRKIRSKKVSEIVIDTFTISVGWFIALISLGYVMGPKTAIKQLFPITFDNNWFVGAYIILYIMHPCLNAMCNNIGKHMHLFLVVAGMVLYGVVQIVVPSQVKYCSIIGFLLIYIVVCYMKSYLPVYCKSVKQNLSVFIISSALLLVALVGLNWLGNHYSIFFNKMLRLCAFNNILIILMAISAFNLFNSMIPFHSKFINYISSITLLVYLLHENILFRDNIKPLFWRMIYDSYGLSMGALWTVFFAIICFAGSVVIATIYKASLQRVLFWICDKISYKLKPKLEKYMVRIVQFR